MLDQRTTGKPLRAALDERGDELRPPGVVMQPEMLGAVRLTRYSFSRTMLRRAAVDHWTARSVKLDMNELGEGEAIYEVDTGDHRFSFVAFTTTLDESEHTDRVIADRWEITGCLVEGELTDDLLAMVRREVPRQEDGRLDSRVLVLTRGNRSVRFFQYLVDTLAAGTQPDPDIVADAGYIMRSTAFYGNGKYGMRSFEGYPEGHPLAAPYRAQFLCAWLFRELSYDVVEACARAKGTGTAASFDDEWRRYFGLGNATGLGLIPYAFKHPAVLNAWVGIREMALADVRRMAGSGELIARIEWWIERARRHFTDGTDDDRAPFLNPAALVDVLDSIAAAFVETREHEHPFDALYRWAETEGPETREMVVSLLLELHDADDDSIDELLIVNEHVVADPRTTVGDVRSALGRRFGWLADLDLEATEADAFWWVISDNTDEPRRVLRQRLAPEHRDVAVDIALRVARLQAALGGRPSDEAIHHLLVAEPEHRLAVERVLLDDCDYGEPRDNACAPTYAPLQLQRFQLAMYGMDNFKPKSTDWLRVTLFQGGPRLTDLSPGLSDDWVLPPRPRKAR